MINIETIINMLSWENDESTQQRGIKLANQFIDIQPLIQPGSRKSVWENCAKVLINKSDDMLQPCLLPILEWLQDITWPGALKILERLKTFNADLLINPFIQSVKIAISKNDIEWILHLSGLLENKELLKKIKHDYSDLYLILVDKYKSFWK